MVKRCVHIAESIGPIPIPPNFYKNIKLLPIFHDREKFVKVELFGC